jgi:hypothetical protein
MQQRDLDGAHVLLETHQAGALLFFCADDVWLRNKLSLKLSACARVCLFVF